MADFATKRRAFEMRLTKAAGSDGTFAGYASVWGVTDSYREIVAKGAFLESLADTKAKGRKLPILWQHRGDEPIGQWNALREDEHGLYGEGELWLDDAPYARLAKRGMASGAISGLSIGYFVRADSFDETARVRTLAYVEEQQILAGDGTGQNLLGLIPQATAYAVGTYSAATDTKIDRLRRAMLQVRVAEYRTSGFVLNPVDWADIQLMKDSEGRYIWSDPTVNNGFNIWGLPVVETNAIAAGKFLAGAFNMAASVIDREEASVEVSTEDSDNFRRNMVTILAEERLALAVFRPDSFVYGNLATGTTP